MSKFTHWLAHSWDVNPKEVVIKWVGVRLFSGIRCTVCGKVEGEHDTLLRIPEAALEGATLNTWLARGEK